MSTAVHHHISLDEFISRPDRQDGQREELIEGELLVSPGAKVWHAGIIVRLRDQLAVLKSYVFANDFSCILGDRSMPIPDLAAISRDRWIRSESSDGWLQGSPELVIEVSSPSNRKLQRKAGIYLEHGAEQVWIVYPKSKTVTVMTAEATSEARIGESLEFHGISVPVDSIFPQ